MLADRMAVLHRGRTLQTGTPEDVTNRPASAEVARLVGLRNVFAGEVAARDSSGCLIITWAGLQLETAQRLDLSSGQAISWVIPDGFVILHRRDRPSRGEHENPVPGIIESVLPIGQIAHLTLRPNHDPNLPIHFSVPLHGAPQWRGAWSCATVSLLAEDPHHAGGCEWGAERRRLTIAPPRMSAHMHAKVGGEVPVAEERVRYGERADCRL